MPEGNTTVSYFDKFGQTVIQNQLGNGQTLSTIFAYDNLGQVKQVTNAANHFTRYGYDLLGRVKQKETSASGRTSYKYDELGQVVEKIDGNDLIINYEYDFNRLIRVSGHEISTKFRYEQGGRLALMDDNTGTHAFKYGKLGEVVEDLKMIRDKNGTQRYFKTKYKYDSWGRILQIIYPDREKVFYRYNSVGQLISMVNQDNFEYLTNVKYTYFDQPYFIQYGNKVEMVQEFDSLERLRAAQFGTRQGNNHLGIFSRNVYRYDRNNNISDVYNEYSQEERLNIGGRYKKNYKYDAFNRLADAYGQWEGKFEVHSYNLEMKYSKDHSIAVKKQSHRVYDRNSQQTRNTENALTRNYQYGDADVPQLTAIEGSHADGIGFYQKFKYMANGNINEIESSGNIPHALEYQQRMIDWDGNNNIIQIKENTGITSTYLYDGKGERVIKRLSGGNNLNINGEHMQDGMYGTDEVLYPSGNLVYTDSTYTKHYYANAKRIASRIGNSNDILHFERDDFNGEEFSTTGPNRPDLPLSSTNRGKSTSIRSVSGPTSGSSRTNGLRDVNGNGSQMSETICRNQIDFLLNSLYNTPEKEYCRRQLLAIIEEFTRYETRCVEPSSNPNQPCLRYERVAVGVDYCLALEKINATGCVKYTDDGLIIDPETGYIYDPLTGIPYDPITKKPIDLGLITDHDEEEARRRRLQLECYNLLLDYIHYYEEIDDKPQSYYELLRYYMCLNCTKCEDCAYLPGVTLHEDGVTYIINFCTLVVPPLPRDPDPQPEPEPEFPAEEIGEGEEEEWQDDRQESRPIEANPLEQHGPVWWYHSDHLGSTSYITDVFGKPVQYIEYLPFGEIMVEQSTNNILENVYKFNGKELDTQTGYYYYGARYYDPGASIFLSVDPLAEKYPGINPYTYVANNPINFTDPTGMVIEPGSQKQWDKQKQNVVNERDRLQGKIDGLNSKAESKGWSTEKLGGKIGNMQERVNSLNGTIDNLGVLEVSSQVYALKSGAGEQGGTTYDPSTGNIVFSYDGTANFVHETTHGGQFESGNMAFDANTGTSYGSDVFDEIAAYKAQFGYSPSSVSGLTSSSKVNSFGGITISWLQGLTKSDGSKIYSPGGSTNTGISPIDMNTNRDGLIKAYPHQKSTLSKLPASFTLKDVSTIYYKK